VTSSSVTTSKKYRSNFSQDSAHQRRADPQVLLG
jgi:hypothetical protein